MRTVSRLRRARAIVLATAAALGALGLAGAQTTPATARGVIVDVHGEINPASAAALKRRLEQAQSDGAAVVVLDVDTPGGRVDAAIEMADAILNSPLPSVAVVTNAFSAGALVAMSAEQVGMLPGSEIGAALPITSTGEAIDGLVGEKVNSALRAKFRSVAQTRGRPADLAEGMVNPNSVIAGLKDRGEILTLTAQDAVKYGIANFEARTLPDAARTAGFGNVRLERLEITPAERAGAFLTQPIVAAALLGIGVLGLVIELLHPGIALPGVIGGVALLAYFGGSYLVGNASSVAFLLFVAGLLLLAAELVLIPGTTLVGLAGIASILASIYLSFGDQFLQVAVLAVVITGAGLTLALWLLPGSAFTRRFALSTSLEGATSTDNPVSLLGRHGVALSDLRPAGLADLEGERMDVVTQGEFIEHGTALEVVRVEGRRVVVRAMRQRLD